MKYIIGIFIVILTTYGGYVYSLKYSDKKRFFISFLDFNEKLYSEISFSQSTLIQIIDEYRDEKEDFYLYLLKYFKENNLNIQNIHLKYLSKIEVQNFNNYLKTIGSGDKNSQLQFLNSMQKSLNDKVKKITEEEEKYKNLSIKMGFFVGLMIFIILL